MERMETNKFDMKVNVCCASCAHKCLNGVTQERECGKHGRKVAADDSCDDWQMSEAMKRVGNAEGRVKHSFYLKYVQKVRLAEQQAIEAGTMKHSDKLSVEEIRQQFEEQYLISPYLSKNNQ